MEGKTILFISHKLDEILNISDTVTVMRQGKHIWTRPNVGLTKQELAEAMVGRSVLFTIDKKTSNPGEPVLELSDVSLISHHNSSKKVLDEISLYVRKGEIVGIAGVEGNGQYELIQLIIGLLKVNEGHILIKGKENGSASIRERRKEIAYIPQDRKTSGSAQNNSITDNAIMTHHYQNEELVHKNNMLNKRNIHQFVDKLISDFNVICPNRDISLSSLSGGNQQKVIVGREFLLNKPLLILDQPIRGLDVGSIEYIQHKILDQREKGAAILLVSADLDELINICDRILVMYRGKIVFNKKPEETNKLEIGGYMLGSNGEGA